MLFSYFLSKSANICVRYAVIEVQSYLPCKKNILQEAQYFYGFCRFLAKSQKYIPSKELPQKIFPQKLTPLKYNKKS